MANSQDNKSTLESVKNILASKEYNRLRLQLEHIENRRKSRWFRLLYITAYVAFSCIVYFIINRSINRLIINALPVPIILGVLIGLAFYSYSNLIFDMRESRIRGEMLNYETDYLKNDTEEDIFENSIKMSYKYLDQYYLQTREHAQRGFFVTVCVAIFGALLIGIGIIAMFMNRVTPSYITCASGVIIEFISSVFFYLYNKTVSSMSKYHNKLVLSQNISIALKVADSLPEANQVDTKQTIVGELLKDINTHLIEDELYKEE